MRGGDVCGGRGDAHRGRFRCPFVHVTCTQGRGDRVGSWARSGASFDRGVMAPYLRDTRRDRSCLAECSSTRRPEGRLTPMCAGRLLFTSPSRVWSCGPVQLACSHQSSGSLCLIDHCKSWHILHRRPQHVLHECVCPADTLGLYQFQGCSSFD